MRMWLCLLWSICALPMMAGASPDLFRPRGSLFAPTPTLPHQPASLFTGRATTGMFAPPLPRPARPVQRAREPQRHNGPATHLRDLIALAEAGGDGYDAIQHGARIRPKHPPTQMTLAQIYTWIDTTPRQPHAIGRYQFIPDTLRRLVSQAGVPLDTRFSPTIQDQLADILLNEAGLHRAITGDLPRRAFMHNLARIWAGLPLPNGKSYYHGHAGNRATMTWARFDAGMRRIIGG
ncbi:MAG: hypothetical protein ACPGFA_06200 [Pikeienuella sp.]